MVVDAEGVVGVLVCGAAAASGLSVEGWSGQLKIKQLCVFV